MIFVDSNILCSNFYMRGPSFEVMKKVGTIVIGEIVFDEVINKYREMLTEHLQKAQKSIDGVNRFFPSDIVILSPSIDVESSCEQYRDFLEMHIIESGLSIPEGYPPLTHKEIVSRELQRKKPFKPNGSGYRDYLVWRTVLDAAKSYASEEFHFITDNTQDFSDTKQKEQLHPDLQQDLDDLGIGKDRFHYWPSIKAFLDNYATAIANQIDLHDSIVREIESNIDGYQVPIQSFIDEHIIGKNVDQYEVLYPGREGVLKGLEFISDYSIERISELNEDGYLLEITIDSIGDIHSSASIIDIPEFREDEFSFEIIKQDENECLLESFIGLQINLLAIYNRTTNSVSSIELDDLGDYYCPYCN